MKRIFTICLLFLSTFLAIAQEQKNVSLNWTDKKELSYGRFSYMVPQFNTQNYEFDVYSKTVSYSLTIPLNSMVNENAIQISNLIFEPILESQLGDIAIKNTPATFKSKFKSVQQNYVHADEFFLKFGKKQKAKHCYTSIVRQKILF